MYTIVGFLQTLKKKKNNKILLWHMQVELFFKVVGPQPVIVRNAYFLLGNSMEEPEKNV